MCHCDKGYTGNYFLLCNLYLVLCNISFIRVNLSVISMISLFVLTGKLCEIELSNHICDNNPCKNNGTCKYVPGVKNYECICAPGNPCIMQNLLFSFSLILCYLI